MEHICNTVQGLKPALLMVVVQVVSAGMNVFYKLAANDGMSMRVLVAYRLLFASALIVPLALYLERNRRPKLTWVVVCQAFLCGLFGGSMGQNLFAKSLVLTSATFVSAMSNLIPAITFALAISFGVERLGCNTMAGKAKVVGTLIGIGGAMLLTLYKGAEINIWSTHLDLLHHHQHLVEHVAASHLPVSGNPVLGAFLAICSCTSTSLWYIIQAKMVQRYPSTYSSSALMVLMGSIQAVGFALCMERDWTQWKLGWNIRLLIVTYSGIVSSGLSFTLIPWVVLMRGPLFASVFNPLVLVLVAIAGSLVLDEKLHLGSVLGAILIICGLYVVLWGKDKEMKRIAQLMPSKSSTESERIKIVHSSSQENESNSNINIVPTMPNVALDGDLSLKYKGEEEGKITKLNVNL